MARNTKGKGAGASDFRERYDLEETFSVEDRSLTASPVSDISNDTVGVNPAASLAGGGIGVHEGPSAGPHVYPSDPPPYYASQQGSSNSYEASRMYSNNYGARQNLMPADEKQPLLSRPRTNPPQPTPPPPTLTPLYRVVTKDELKARRRRRLIFGIPLLILIIFAIHRFIIFWQMAGQAGWPSCPEGSKHREFTEKWTSSQTDHLHLQQVHESPNRVNHHIHSEIHVRRASDDSKDYPIAVSITWSAATDDLLDSITVKSLPGDINVQSDGLPGRYRDDQSACIHIRTEISIAPGTNLRSINITSIRNRHVIFHDGLSLAAEALSVDSRASSIRSDANPSDFHADIAQLHSHAGSIEGRWALLDRLTLSTHAGHIKVDVAPQPRDGPAEFKASSHAGAIEVHFPDNKDNVPERKYHLAIDSHAGHVSGDYLLDDETTFDISAGSLDADIYPVRESTAKNKMKLLTDTQVGRTGLRLHEPLRGKEMRGLISNHKSSAGRLDIKYPAMWEGAIDGEATVGSMHLQGKGIKVLQEGRKGVVGKFIKAEKRTKDKESVGELRLRTATGSIDVLVG